MLATVVAVLSVPAFAGTARLPEPGTMTLLACGIGGVAVVRRLLKR